MHDLNRVETLFQAAADLEPAARAAYLDAECAQDAELRGRVEALLGRLDRDETLARPAGGEAGHAGPFPAAIVSEGPGSTIDRYKLLQVIGEGGFGVVYMAEQQQPVVRKVALKIIKLGMDTREVVARFEAERQALAMMDHPNIARVLDGGATRSGRPYFVMELVRGVAITDFCDRNALGTAERLELFESVCQAVQHAHQKGVIHRDIKPTNVLVSLADGRPIAKVIDFGVAKAMHTRLTEKTLFTRFEQFIGTPSYMSPEQAEMSALDVDTRTDIYSLGVLLYELLTGTTPLDSATLTSAGLAEIQRVIREEQPPRPSLRISTTAPASISTERRDEVARQLRGDLDWIVMKAIEKDRSRRYATASELAEDIARHRRREPVVAGPPGAAYRLRKFVARNRAALVTVSVVVLVLIGGIVGTTLGMIQSTRNADLARQRAAHALAALDFLDETLSLTDSEVSMDPELSVQTLLAHTSDVVSEAFAGQPLVEARIRTTIGRAYTSLSQNELAEPHLRRAVELVDSVWADDDAAARFEAAGYDLGDFYTTLWTLTNVSFNLERGDSFAVSHRAREVGLEHLGKSHPELGAVLGRFKTAVENGAWSVEPDAMAGVDELFERTVALSERSVEPGDPLWLIIADSYLAAGYALWYTTHEPMAEQYWGRALEIQQRELNADHPDIATTVGLLAGVLNNLGRGDEAEQLMRDSIESLKRVLREGHFRIAIAESNLGETVLRQGRFEEAEELLLRSHEIILETIGSESNFMVLESLARLAYLYKIWERPELGAPYRDSLARTAAFGTDYKLQWNVARAAFGPEHADLVARLDRIKEICGSVSLGVESGTRQDPSLGQLLGEIATIRHAQLGDDPARSIATARLLMGWANALDPVVHANEHRVMAEQALEILTPHAERRALEIAEAHAILATALASCGEPDGAREHAAAAARLIEPSDPRESWFTAATRARVGRVLLEHGMAGDAEPVIRSALDVIRSQLGAAHADTRATVALLAEAETALEPDD